MHFNFAIEVPEFCCLIYWGFFSYNVSGNVLRLTSFAILTAFQRETVVSLTCCPTLILVLLSSLTLRLSFHKSTVQAITQMVLIKNLAIFLRVGIETFVIKRKSDWVTQWVVVSSYLIFVVWIELCGIGLWVNKLCLSILLQLIKPTAMNICNKH